MNIYPSNTPFCPITPIPDGPLTVGLDGGFVRAWHKRGCFEVIVGKSVLKFKREAEGEEKSKKCFAFVQIFDEKPDGGYSSC